MGKYYSLVAGLPDLLPDDQKLRMSLADFRAEIEGSLSSADSKVIGLLLLKYDNENLLKLFKNREAKIDVVGTLKPDELLEIIDMFKEVDCPRDKRIPPYFMDFIPALIADVPLFDNVSWEDQLSSVYYNYATKASNKFAASWFSMNLYLTNSLTALNCRKHGLSLESAIVGDNEVSDALRTSQAKDFGLLPIFPEIDDILRIAEIEDLYERERKVDMFKWSWLDETGFFHYFDIERLFIYMLKLDMLERWTRLEKATGRKVFREMIAQMQHSFAFPANFKPASVK